MARVRDIRVENLTPARLLELAMSGRIRLPEFQRGGYRWRVREAVDLVDSLIRRYPIGSPVLWERPAPAGQVVFGHVTIEAAADPGGLWVVDGQQRMTTLIGNLASDGPPADPRFAVCVNLETLACQSFPDRDPGEPWVPLRAFGSTAAMLAWRWANDGWLRSSHQEAIDDLAVAVLDHSVPVLVVDTDDEEEVRALFARINNHAVALTGAEVFDALHGRRDTASPKSAADILGRIGSTGFGTLGSEIVMSTLQVLHEGQGGQFSAAEHRRTLGHTERALLDVVGILREDAGIPHVRLLPQTSAVVVLAVLVHRFGRPHGRVAELLRRWIWRGAVAGEPPDTASALEAVSLAGSAREAVRLLLSLLPAVTAPWTPDLGDVDGETAGGRVVMLGMWSLGPRRLGTGGEPLTKMELFETTSWRPGVILTDTSSALGETMANRLLHPRPDRGADLVRALLTADETVLRSHCVDQECARLLASGDHRGFLVRRAKRLGEVVRRYVDERAEWGARDGRSAADLLRGTDRA